MSGFASGTVKAWGGDHTPRTGRGESGERQARGSGRCVVHKTKSCKGGLRLFDAYIRMCTYLWHIEWAAHHIINHIHLCVWSFQHSFDSRSLVVCASSAAAVCPCNNIPLAI